MQKTDNISVALADDHTLFRRGLISILKPYKEINIIFDASNGQELMQKLGEATQRPDVCIIDINMPVMNGYDTAKRIKNNFPGIKILALSMYNDENNIIQMLRSGANGYVLKDSEPTVLVEAIKAVVEYGSYHSELITENVLNKVKQPTKNAVLNAQETLFLKYSCTDMTYKEIAAEMAVSERTVDGYRDKLFEKLNVKSRIGLVMYALDHNLVEKY